MKSNDTPAAAGGHQFDSLHVAVAVKVATAVHPRYGYSTLHGMLRAQGHVINPKCTYRIYREEGLQVRTKRRKKLTRPRVPMVIPNAVNQRWSMDFVSDQLAPGRRFRVLNIVDDFSRGSVAQIADFSISGTRVARELNRLDRPLPETIVCDNVLPMEVNFSCSNSFPSVAI